MSKVILNGKIIAEKYANISIMDKGYFFDFAVYSSLKVVQGKIFFADYHVDRLLESAELIGLKHKFKKEEILNWLNKLVKVNKITDALLRIVFIGDPDGGDKVKLFIFSVGGLTFYPDKLYKHGAKVITYHGERRIPKSKSKDLLMSFLAYGEARAKNALDALLIDRGGCVREGTRTNFFAIKDNILYTPPAEKVLDGITKKIILEVVKDDFEIKHQDILLKDLKDFDEIFISSTSMNVMPVNQVDDFVFATNFEKTRLIAKLFKEYYNREVLKK